jgi:bacteriocin biosynthesis cyclodehydratase domain-containing protein
VASELDSPGAAERRFTRNPHLTLIPCGEDEVVVKHGSRSRFSRVIRDERRGRLLGRLLRHVDAPTSLAELEACGVLAAEEYEAALAMVAYLEREGVLVDPRADVTRVYLETLLGAADAGALSATAVGIVGAGYLGSRMAGELARLGVGKLIALDDRRVRHAPTDARYFDLAPGIVRDGLPYVEALAEQFRASASEALTPLLAPVDDEASLRQVVAQARFVVAAFECFSSNTLHALNELAIEAGVPWMSVYMDGSESLIGPIYVPGESCCYNEFEIQHEATLGSLKDDYLLYKEALNDARLDGSHLALPPYLSVAAGMAASAILRFLLLGRCFLVGRCLRLDHERLSVDCEEVLRLPRCPACGSKRPAPRHLFM